MITIGQAHPESMISSSKPYSFICCSPHPSLIRFGMYFFFQPFKLGVWNMAILTRSPNSVTSGARSVPHDGSGSSRVPRRASVKMETSRPGLFWSASRMVSTSSCSVLPIYNVDMKMRLLAPRIFAW